MSASQGKKREGKIDINDSKLFAVSREGACHVRTLSGQSVNPRVCVCVCVQNSIDELRRDNDN